MNFKEKLTSLLPAGWQPFNQARSAVRHAAKGRVISGPFAGMRYVEDSICSAYEPKLLGCYEIELHAAMRELLARNFDRVIDIGAAEGYYAVGWALKAPNSGIIAFEGTAEGRALLERMAELNHVQDRLAIRGFCHPPDLAAAIAGSKKPLLIMDVEGAEKELLDPIAIGDLARAEIVVEIHEFVHRGIGSEIRKRFAPTHRIVEIPSRERMIADSPVRGALLDRWLLKLLREFRPEPMQWLILSPIAQ